MAAVAPLVEFSARFGRIFVLTRLLTPGEFGIVIAITIVIGTAELVTDVGLDRFILLKPTAEARQALAAAHALQIFRGLLLSAAIAVLAVPTVTFFGIPQAVASFQLAALIPLIRSFANLGIKQIQRDYDYRPEALAVTTSSVTALAVAALAAATIMPDHRVIVLAFLVEAAVYVAASHILARSPMWVIPDRETLRRSLAYGVPLMLNGAGLALIGQADRVVVGRLFGMDILGVYAVILESCRGADFTALANDRRSRHFNSSPQPRQSEAPFGNLSLASLVLRVSCLQLCRVYRIDARCSGTVGVW